MRAPNGGNTQRWNCLVIKDTETKRWIGERYGMTPVPQLPADGVQYGPTKRRPVEEVTYGEKWGEAWEAKG